MDGKFLSDLDEKLRCSDTGDESCSYRCEMSSSETKSWIIEVIKLYFIVPTNEQNKIGLLQDLESQHKANVSYRTGCNRKQLGYDNVMMELPMSLKNQMWSNKWRY